MYIQVYVLWQSLPHERPYAYPEGALRVESCGAAWDAHCDRVIETRRVKAAVACDLEALAPRHTHGAQESGRRSETRELHCDAVRAQL